MVETDRSGEASQSSWPGRAAQAQCAQNSDGSRGLAEGEGQALKVMSKGTYETVHLGVRKFH